MDIPEQSGVGTHQSLHSPYEELKYEYLKSGITYKSNQVLHKITELKGYPYALMIDVAKLYHMNQFEVIFFCHILNDQQCPYQSDPVIFQTNMNMAELTKIYNRLSKNGQQKIKVVRITPKIEQEQEQDQEEGLEEASSNVQFWSLKQLRKLYIYLLVIGYSVKYYLNQSIKVYEDEMKRKYPEFFSTIFNVWAEKYGTKVLRTNPRKINQFYVQLFQNQESTQIDNAQIDCQYRNYNQIVQELIKATSDIEQIIHEQQKDYTQN